jgi:OmpA-OmpF porin, OOP family
MIKTIRISLASATLLLASPVVLAASDDAGPYVGAGIGQSRIKQACSEGVISCSRTDTGFKLTGGYRLNSSLALEAGYIGLGKFTRSSERADAELKMHALTLAAVGSLPVTESVALQAKLGMFHSTSKYAITSGDFRTSDSNGKNGMLLGLGVGYALTKNVQARLDYDFLSKAAKLPTDEKNNAHLVTVGLNYLF